MIELSGDKKEDGATFLEYKLRRVYGGLSVRQAGSTKDEIRFEISTNGFGQKRVLLTSRWVWSGAAQKWECYSSTQEMSPADITKAVDEAAV
jgi:hypothetical protein